jgi:hypothetical protein
MTSKPLPVGAMCSRTERTIARSSLLAQTSLTPNGTRHRAMNAVPLPEAFAYTVPDACRMGGFGRTLLYKLAKNGRLRLLKVGGRTLVCGNSLRGLIAEQA